MCEHVWKRLCKIPKGGACPWCDKCEKCGIKPIDVREEKVNEK
jgi:hypothetical protein